MGDVEYLATDSTPETDTITVQLCEDAPGWLLSSPQTAIFSKMRLQNSENRRLSRSLYRSLSQSDVKRLEVACQVSSKELQYQLSISSDISVPGMMEDTSTLSGSETSFEDNHSCETFDDGSAGEALWDTWFPRKASVLASKVPIYPISPKSQPWDMNVPPWKEDYISSKIPALNIAEPSADPTRADELWSRRLNRELPPLPQDSLEPASLPTLPRTTYSSTQTPPVPKTQPSKCLIPPQNNSQPALVESHTECQRPRNRSNTTPAQFIPTHPSNLSTCTTLYSPPLPNTAKHIYTRSAPSSPLYPTPASLMDIFVQEKSVFDEDDSDDDDENEGLVKSLRTKLHIRSANAGDGERERLWIERRRKRSGRSLSDALKGVFSKKKSGSSSL